MKMKSWRQNSLKQNATKSEILFTASSTTWFSSIDSGMRKGYRALLTLLIEYIYRGDLIWVMSHCFCFCFHTKHFIPRFSCHFIRAMALVKSFFSLNLRRRSHLHCNREWRLLSTFTENFRSDLCGNLAEGSVGKEVSVCGWLHKKRMDKFWIVRDWTGHIQVLLDEENARKLAETDLPHESVIRYASRPRSADWLIDWLAWFYSVKICISLHRVCGVVQPRPLDQVNPDMPTGKVEIHASNVSILNTADANLPFSPAHRKVKFTCIITC